MEFNYGCGDASYGVITSRCRKGSFVKLSNDESAFCPGTCNLPNGTKIICSIIRPSTDRYIVRLDSVCSVFEAA